MKRSCGALFALALLASSADAQVIQSGAVAPGHIAIFIAPGVIGDGGNAASGLITSLGVTASGPGICQNSGALSGAYNQLCFAPTVTGGQITFTSYGGATGTLSFNVNGTIYTPPFTTANPVVTGTFNINGISGAGAASKYVCTDSSGNVLTQSGAC